MGIFRKTHDQAVPSCASAHASVDSAAHWGNLAAALLSFLMVALAAILLATSAPDCADAASLTSGRLQNDASSTSCPSNAKTYDEFIGLDSDTLVLATANTRVKVYKSYSKPNRVLGSFSKNNCIVVDTSKMKKGTKYTWLKVKLKGKARGYVMASQVSLRTLDTKTFGLDPKNPLNKLRIKICRKGLPYIGVPYRGNGKDISTGLRCNKFVWTCLNAAGLKIAAKHNSISGLVKLGKASSRDKLVPGDLVFYRASTRSKSPSHSTIYIGKGLIINSSGAQGTDYPTGGVRISRLDYRVPSPSFFRNIRPLLVSALK